MIKQINLLLFFVFWIFSLLISYFTKMPKFEISKQDSALNISHNFLTFFSLGQKRLIADILWVQTLIESDLDHYKKNDLNSWMFLRFNSIARLDPKFYENYLYGGQYLSIVKDDILGAEIILQKGINYFDNDYYLNFQLGYVYAFEKGDFLKSKIYYEKIKNSPLRTKFFDSFYSRILNESVGPEQALYFSQESLLRAEKNSILYQKLKKNITSLQIEIDLNCLNNSNSNLCNKTDPYGNLYFKINGVFHCKSKYEKLKIYKIKK
jgi:hypothetical protein